MTVSHDQLLRAACEARLRSHSPYSRFRVGAALLCRNGRIVTGTNVENVSFGLSMCAERVAIGRAIAEGERDFVAIAICADGPVPTPPCGACRQVLLEFGAELDVIMGGENGPDGPVKNFSLLALVPEAFVDFTPGAPDAAERERP